MDHMQKHNLYNIKRSFERKTGTRLISAYSSPGRMETPQHCVLRPVLLIALIAVFGLSLAAFAWPLFSPLDGDALVLNATYEGDGIVSIQVENRSHKKLEFQPQIKLFHWITGEEVSQHGQVSFEGTAISPNSTQAMTLDLSEAYNLEALEQSASSDWYYILLTNADFIFGQEWKCSVFFGQETEMLENHDVPVYSLAPTIQENIDEELQFYFEDDYVGTFAGNPLNYEYLQKVEEYLLRCGKAVVHSINPELLAESVPDGIIFDETVAPELQYTLRAQHTTLHDAFGKYVAAGAHEAFQMLGVYLPAYEGSDDQSWILPLVYLATYAKSDVVTGEEVTFIHGQLVSFNDLADCLIYEGEDYLCYNVTRLFYTDLRIYVENVVAMDEEYYYYEEQFYTRIENVYNYCMEHLSLVPSRDYIFNSPTVEISGNGVDEETGIMGILSSEDLDILKIEISIEIQSTGEEIYYTEIIPNNPHYFDLSNATEVTAFIQSLEEDVYGLDVNLWVDGDTNSYYSLWSMMFTVGNSTIPVN